LREKCTNLNVKGAEFSSEVESKEGGVEDLRHDGGDHTAEERLPAERLGPE